MIDPVVAAPGGNASSDDVKDAAAAIAGLAGGTNGVVAAQLTPPLAPPQVKTEPADAAPSMLAKRPRKSGGGSYGGAKPVSQASPYCVCRRLRPDFMVECSVCLDWFHGECVGITAAECERIDQYHCPDCVKTHGPSTLRPQSRQSTRDVQRPDYTALVDGERNRDRDFLAMIAARAFTPAAFPSIKGSDLTLAYLREHNFLEPFLVPSPEDLGMVMPGPDFSVDDVKAYVGGDREIFVIDVATQQEKVAWNMNQFAYYFSHPDVRRRIYNVISLEFSDSPMAAAVRRPAIVDALDWISLAWPPERVATRSAQEYPKVQMYCLMSVAGSYTDFHIDFGGSSVFYHLISGEKLFYFIPPTPDNLKRYERWSNSPDQSDTFFGDLAGPCLSVELLPGQTLFIPSGWIHAVATPRDSIVIGGNFVHALSVPMQLAVERIEEATQVPHRFRFPFFRHLHWFYAEYLLGRLGSGADDVATMSALERDSVATLVRYLGSMLTPLKTADDRANWKINSPFDRHRATAIVRALATLLDLPEAEVLGQPLGHLPIPALQPRYYEWSSPRKAKRQSPGA